MKTLFERLRPYLDAGVVESIQWLSRTDPEVAALLGESDEEAFRRFALKCRVQEHLGASFADYLQEVLTQEARGMPESEHPFVLAAA